MEGNLTLKAKVITYGCQMNLHDSEILKDILLQRNYQLTQDIDEAQLVLVNTCSIREHAEQKVFSLLGELKSWKEKTIDRKIGLSGCMAQEYGSKFFKRIPQLDFVLGTHQLVKLGSILDRMDVERGPILETKTSPFPTQYLSGYRESPFKAWITVMEGCNLSCSYCIVPYVRGIQRSRSLAEIVGEAEELAGRGFKEITLLGQTVNAYGLDLSPQIDFSDLLEALHRILGIERIRYTSSHPSFATKKFFEKVKDLPKVCEHFHLPVQSGSNRILKAMHRTYTVEQYMEKVEWIRELYPHFSLTTDVIVGFPGETEEDFQDTLTLLRQAQFDSAYTFKYSKRPHTPAADQEDNIPENIKKERLKIFNQELGKTALAKNKKLEGLVKEILVHEFTPEENQKEKGRLVGHTRCFKEVYFQGNKDLVGQSVDVKIKEAYPWCLSGSLVASQ